MVEINNSQISIVRQCELLGINRSAYYYQPKSVSEGEIDIMNRIDKIYTEFPYYGYRKITAQLGRDKLKVNRKKVLRLMRIMGIQAIYPKKNTSKKNMAHPVYPYLLKGLDINHPNHVWGTDITYIRANGIWFYLVAILDWFSRYVVSWRLSKNMSVDFCRAGLKEALTNAVPEYHNSDQGSQFTCEEYIKTLKSHEKIKISMDGRGRCFDNIFTERLWRTVKYEEVYLKSYRSFAEAEESLSNYFRLYNHKRLHEALNYQPPAEVYFK